MSINPTKLRFPFDSLLIMRAAGQAAVGVDTGTTAMPLDVMTAYWNDLGENANLHLTMAVIQVESIETDTGNEYDLIVQVSPTSNFAVSREVFSLKIGASGWYFLPILREEVEYTKPETGSIAFATTAETGDSHTIDDGVNSRTFVAGTDYLVGASATASGDNLAAAINSDGNLRVVATAVTGTVTIRNDRLIGGTITENTDGGGDITTTNFSGGIGVAHYVRVFVDVTSAGAKEEGTVVFIDEPTANDAITISDGVDEVTFVFGAGGGQVPVGADETEAGDNLETAINGSILNVTATNVAGTVTIVNDNYVGGSITEDVDAANDFTVTNFAGGVAPASIAFWGYLSA